MNVINIRLGSKICKKKAWLPNLTKVLSNTTPYSDNQFHQKVDKTSKDKIPKGFCSMLNSFEMRWKTLWEGF